MLNQLEFEWKRIKPTKSAEIKQESLQLSLFDKTKGGLAQSIKLSITDDKRVKNPSQQGLIFMSVIRSVGLGRKGLVVRRKKGTNWVLIPA